MMALGLWLGFCLFMALQDRTPRGYVFLSVGHMASIIGFPAVVDPRNIMSVAIVRIQEIPLAIASASFVHWVILPRSVTAQFLCRVDL